MGSPPWLKNGGATPSAQPAAAPAPVTTEAAAHPMTGGHPLTIVRLTAENVKRLRAVTIAPDGNLVVLSGKNGQGKTSVLDAIEYALGGKPSVAEPVRRGEDSADIVCDLGDLIVRRRFVAGGGTSLEVSSREGLRYPSPQKILDELVGKLTFDPLAFARQAPKEQQATLRTLLGLDFSADDQRHTALFDERTAVNREHKAAAARLAGLPFHEKAPAAPVSAADLAGKIQLAQQRNADVRRRQDRLAAIDQRAKALQKEIDALAAEWQELSAADATVVQVEPLIAQLAEIDKVNAMVRANQQHAEAAKEVETRKARADELTAQLDAIRRRKEEQIASAKMPVPGLGFGATGVTLNGFQLEQASAAEQLSVSVAIGLAMNPRLRVLLIRDASLLDQDSLKLVAEMAKEAGAQVWLERVESDAATTVLIEDGMAKAVEPQAVQP